MKHYPLFLAVILFSGHLFAQKQIMKQFDDSQLSTVSISGTTIFKISISTKKENNIDLILQVQGENNEQVVLQTHIRRDTLFVESAYQPLFIKPDDKLSAHKKISIELTIFVPEQFNIGITGDIASVFATGNYNYFMTELLNGHFTATRFSGDLLVNTIHGNISLETDAAQLKLQTKNGTIVQEKINNGRSQISLHSINGNIMVTKTQ
jgi:hypothetical protein